MKKRMTRRDEPFSLEEEEGVEDWDASSCPCSMMIQMVAEVGF
jgi:hypothetical protein